MSNKAQRFLPGGYTFGPANVLKLGAAVARWIRLELSEGWQSWFRPELHETTPMVGKTALAVSDGSEAPSNAMTA
jgi:hypothetical protein